MRKPFRIIDKIMTHVIIVGFLAYMVCGCIVVPETPIAPFVGVGIFVYFSWIVADIYFWFDNKRIEKDIQRYIDSGFDPKSVRRY